jgi:antitoxin ParD1/3/4
LLDQQPSYEAWLSSVRAKVEVGLEQIERGEVMDGETVVANLLSKIEQRRRSESR